MNALQKYATLEEASAAVEAAQGERFRACGERLRLAHDAHIVLHVLVRPAARMGDVRELGKEEAEFGEEGEHRAGDALDVVLAADDDEAGNLVPDQLLFLGSDVDLHAVAWLLVGSVPGILISSRYTVKVPEMTIRGALGGILIISGLKLLNVPEANWILGGGLVFLLVVLTIYTVRVIRSESRAAASAGLTSSTSLTRGP